MASDEDIAEAVLRVESELGRKENRHGVVSTAYPVIERQVRASIAANLRGLATLSSSRHTGAWISRAADDIEQGKL